MSTKYKILMAVTSIIVAIDQAAKYWIRNTIPVRGRPIEVIPGLFQLVHAENSGAAWGLMRDFTHRLPFLIVATVVAFTVIGIYFHKIPKGQNLVALAMSCILGGAIGNFLDRVRFHSVTDYLDFYVNYQPVKGWLRSVFRSNHWPSFNVADIAIVVGLLFIMYDMLFLEKRRAQEAAGKSGDTDIRGVAGEGEAAQ